MKNSTYFTIYINELKLYIIQYFILYIIIFFILYQYSDELLYLYIKTINIQNNKNFFILTKITEAFFTKITICLYTSIFIITPIILFHIWYFISPGLQKNENYFFIKIFILCKFNYILSFFFLYKKIIPITWLFLLSFNNDNKNLIPIFMEPRLENYINFLINLIIPTLLIFQIPIIFIIIKKIFNTIRKIIYLIIILITTLITPPDLYSQIFIIIPILYIFELFIFLKIIFQNYK